MKICLLNDAFPPVIDGVANTVVNYAENLYKTEDTEVMVSTPYYPGEDYSKYPYPVLTYPSFDTTAATGGYRAGYPLAVKEAGSLIAWHPQILHTHCPATSCFLARTVRDASDAPIVLTYHTKYDIDIRNTIPTELLQRETIKALVNNVSACDEVWTVSRGAGENLKSLGYQGEYKVMLNGVDFARGRSTEEEVRLVTSEYDLPADLPVFLFVGRIMDYKGLPMLVDALYKTAQQEDFRMVFVGRGTDSGGLKDKIRHFGIALDEKTENGKIVSWPGSLPKGKCIFTGAISDRSHLRAWNTRADLFVFPSSFDTNGLVVREAAACSLGSVLVRGSCAAEDITDGRNGYLADENPDSFASFLIWACTHKDELHQTGINAMNEIYLSWEDAVKTAHTAYAELIEKNRQGLLPRKKPLFDDPLFEMTADAALQYMHYMNKVRDEAPRNFGMLDNRNILTHKIRDELQEIKDQISRQLKIKE